MMFGSKTRQGDTQVVLAASDDLGSGRAALLDSIRVGLARLLQVPREDLLAMTACFQRSNMDRTPVGLEALATWPPDIRAMASRLYEIGLPAHRLPLFGKWHFNEFSASTDLAAAIPTQSFDRDGVVQIRDPVRRHCPRDLSRPLGGECSWVLARAVLDRPVGLLHSLIRRAAIQQRDSDSAFPVQMVGSSARGRRFRAFRTKLLAIGAALGLRQAPSRPPPPSGRARPDRAGGPIYFCRASPMLRAGLHLTAFFIHGCLFSRTLFCRTPPSIPLTISSFAISSFTFQSFT